MFPYLGFGLLSTDTQPWSLIVSVTILFILIIKTGKIKLPYEYYGFIIVLIIVLVYFLFGIVFLTPNIPKGIISFSYYTTIPLVALAVYNIGLPNNIQKHLLYAISIWFLAAILQLFYPEIIDFIVGGTRSSAIRGVTSLSPEPTWYARSIVLILLLAFILSESNLIQNKILKVIIFISIVQVVLFSFSGTGFIFLVGVLFLWGFFGLKKFSHKLYGSIILLASIIITLTIGFTYFPDMRLFSILKETLINPEYATRFGAFNMRFLNTPMALQAGLIDGKLIGQGVGIESTGNIYTYNFLGTAHFKEDTGYAHGGLVLFIYQIGIFGFIWLFSFIRLILNNATYKSNFTLFVLFSLILLLFFEGSAVNPIAGYSVGALIFMNKINKIL